MNQTRKREGRCGLAVAGVLLAMALGRGEAQAAPPPTAKEPAMPIMTEGRPAAGKFVKQVAPEYQGTEVYHALYLPTDWVAGKLYPVIVEYAGNRLHLDRSALYQHRQEEEPVKLVGRPGGDGRILQDQRAAHLRPIWRRHLGDFSDRVFARGDCLRVRRAA